MDKFAEGWRVSGLGLLSVFGVLLLLYVILNLLMAMFPDRGGDD